MNKFSWGNVTLLISALSMVTGIGLTLTSIIMYVKTWGIAALGVFFITFSLLTFIFKLWMDNLVDSYVDNNKRW